MRSIGAVERALARLGGRQRVTLQVQARLSVQALQRQAQQAVRQVRLDPIPVRVEVQPQQLRQQARAALRQVRLDAIPVRVEISAQQLRQQARQVTSQVRLATLPLRVDLNPPQVAREVRDATERVARDRRNRVDLRVDIDEQSLRRARQRIRRFAQESQRVAIQPPPAGQPGPTTTRGAAQTEAAAQRRLQAERRLNEAVLRSQENFLRARVRADQQNLALRRRLFDAETERRVQGLQRQYQRLAQETREGEQRVNRIIERFRRQRTVERTQVAIPRQVPQIPAPTAAIQGFTQLNSLVGALIPLLGVAGAAAALRGLVSTVADFQLEMNRVIAVTGATNAEFAALEQRALTLGSTTRFTAAEAAGGIRFLGQAGFDTNEILGAIGPTLDLASAGMIDVARAGDIVSNVLRQFGLEAIETGKAADILAVIASNSNTNIEALGSALSFVGPLARTAGIDLETTAAAIGVLGDAGIPAERAGTALRGLLASLTDPSREATQQLANLGLGLSDVDIEINGLIPVLERLRDANLRNADAFAIFERRTASGVTALINAIPQFRNLRGQADNATGAVAAMADVINSRLPGALSQFRSAADGAAQAIGRGGLAEAVIDVLNAFRQIIQQNPELIAAIGQALGNAVRTTANIFVVLGGVINGVGRAIGGLAAVLVSFATLDFSGGVRIAQQAFADIKGTVLEIGEVLNDINNTPPPVFAGLPSPESQERARRAAAPLVGPENDPRTQARLRVAGEARLQSETQINDAILQAQQGFLRARIAAEQDNSALRLQLFDQETQQQLQKVRDQSAALQAQFEVAALDQGRREISLREQKAQTRIALETRIAEETDQVQREAAQKRLAGLDQELQEILAADRQRTDTERTQARARIAQLTELESTLSATRNLERQRLEEESARQSLQRQQRFNDALGRVRQEGLQLQLDRDQNNIGLQQQLFDLETARQITAIRQRFASLVTTTANGQAQLDEIVNTFQQNRAVEREDLGGRGDARERVRDLQQEVAAQRDLADAARLTGRAREDAVASRRLEADLVRQGIDLTSQEAAEIRALNAELVASRRATEALDTPLRRLADSGITNFALIQTAAADAFGSMENALVDFVTTGQLNFSGLVDSILQDLSRIAVQQAIIQPLAQGLFGATSGLSGSSFGGSGAGGLLGSLFASGGGAGAGFQQGGVFPGGGGGGVTRRPTVFGIAGEGGPEAVVPLSGGRSIPVELAGGGADNRTFNITIATPNPEAFTSQRTQSQIRSAISEATDRDRLVDGGRRR